MTTTTPRRRYPCDLSDARWALFEPTLTAWRQARTDAGVGGRPAEHDLRDILDAILYVNRTGIPWRYLPHDYPPAMTVYGYFAAWSRDDIFTRLDLHLTGLARTRSGRAQDPTACLIDTPTVKTATTVPRSTKGYDAGKRLVGRKRGIITDTLGLLPAVVVTAASISDNAIGAALPDQAHTHWPGLVKAWTDTGFKNATVEHGAELGIDVEIVTRPANTRGFNILPRRWMVERTYGWLMQHRRLARAYETRTDRKQDMIHIAMVDNLARRITRETTITWHDPPPTQT